MEGLFVFSPSFLNWFDFLFSYLQMFLIFTYENLAWSTFYILFDES